MLEIYWLGIRYFSMGTSSSANSLGAAAYHAIIFTLTTLLGMHLGGMDANPWGWVYLASLVFIGNAIGCLAQWWTPLSAVVGRK